jgi:hypothetical protein
MRHLFPLLAFAFASAAPAAAAELVPVREFRSIELQGGGTVTVRPGPVQRVTLLRGSTRVSEIKVGRNGRLEIAACKLRCPDGYRLEVLVESPRVPGLAVVGGGSISAARGFPRQPQLSAAISGGGQIDARAVAADTGSAAINGGGLISVHSQSRLSGAVNGGGVIRYWGDPQVASIVNGGGRIVRAN